MRLLADVNAWALPGRLGAESGGVLKSRQNQACLHFAVSGCHNAGMSVQITIRDVPDAVKDELAARAALQGKSMQEYLRAELERLAARPPVEKVLERIRMQGDGRNQALPRGDPGSP